MCEYCYKQHKILILLIAVLLCTALITVKYIENKASLEERDAVAAECSRVITEANAMIAKCEQTMDRNYWLHIKEPVNFSFCPCPAVNKT